MLFGPFGRQRDHPAGLRPARQCPDGDGRLPAITPALQNDRQSQTQHHLPLGHGRLHGQHLLELAALAQHQHGQFLLLHGREPGQIGVGQNVGAVAVRVVVRDERTDLADAGRPDQALGIAGQRPPAHVDQPAAGRGIGRRCQPRGIARPGLRSAGIVGRRAGPNGRHRRFLVRFAGFRHLGGQLHIDLRARALQLGQQRTGHLGHLPAM